MISSLTLTPAQMDEMIRHASEQSPLEACGLLSGKNGQVEQIFLVRNQAQSPVRFVMDPYEQLQAFERIDAQGRDLLGIFHSHPAGPATPSATDVQEAAYEVVYIILSPLSGRWNARGFWIEQTRVTEIPLAVTDG